jgi:anti-anti-sigma factor
VWPAVQPGAQLRESRRAATQTQRFRRHHRFRGPRPGPFDHSCEAGPVTASDELQLRTRSYGGERIVELAGPLDHASCDLLAETLEQAIDAGVGTIVLDLVGVVRIDRAAVLTILLAHLRVSDQQAQLLIIPGTTAVREALQAIQGPFTYAGPEHIDAVNDRNMEPTTGRWC